MPTARTKGVKKQSIFILPECQPLDTILICLYLCRMLSKWERITMGDLKAWVRHKMQAS